MLSVDGRITTVEPPESSDYWTNDGAARVATDNRRGEAKLATPCKTVIAGSTRYGVDSLNKAVGQCCSKLAK